MKKEDFPLVVIDGVCYRLVPELPEPHLDFRCEGCAACPVGGQLDRELCRHLFETAQRVDLKLDCSEGADTGEDIASLYVREDQFEEYVVELVRRRVS
jgi:hypothetical protein